MPHRLKKCKNCQRYTMSTTLCPVCKSQVENVHPPKFSMQDKYQDYRIPYFREKMNKKRAHTSQS
ncbi:MAG: nucleolar RNA-binding Nop10p family protein [Promethearchaeota archaeon]